MSERAVMSKENVSPEVFHNRLLGALDRLIRARYGNFKRAEEATGVRRITLRQWRRGSRRPTLHRVLQTLDQLGFTLLEVVREADLYPELQLDPRDRLAMVLPRQEPQEPVLARVHSDPAWSRRRERSSHGIPDVYERLELCFDQDRRIARVEMQEYLERARSNQDRATALGLWAKMLNSQGASIDAGIALRAALDRVEPPCPLYFMLLGIAASVAKNLRALELGKDLAEQSITGFLRAGDRDNAARGLLTLGILHWATRDIAEAERAYREALLLSPDSRFAAMCRFNLIYNHLAEGRIEKALRAVEENRASLAVIPPAYVLRMHWLSAKVLVASGRREVAIAELQAALQSPRILEENPRLVFSVFFELAGYLADAGRLEELPAVGLRLMPLLALGDDSEESVAVSRAFLRSLRSGLLTTDQVHAFARRYEVACEGSSKT